MSKSFAEGLGFEFVDIYVGTERKHYAVHKKLLTSKSEYFNKALNGSFKEADDNCIHLEEEEPETVALLIAWLYRGAIPGTEKPVDPFAQTNDPEREPVIIPVSELGTLYPFVPTPSIISHGAVGQQEPVTLQHICYQFQYSVLSPEELRLADYNLNRKYQSDVPMSHRFTATVPSQPALPVPTGNHFGVVGGIGSSMLGTAVQTAPAQHHTHLVSAGNVFSHLTTPSGSSTSGTATQMAPSQALTPAIQPPSQLSGNIFNHLTAPSGSSAAGTATQVPSAHAAQLHSHSVSAGSMFSHLAAPTSLSIFGSQPTPPMFSELRGERGEDLPPGVVLKTVYPTYYSPSTFNRYPFIKFPKSAGFFIEGIPQSADPYDDKLKVTEKQQLNFLRLCIMAETFCWPKLFNVAVDAYIRGEYLLRHRPIPLEAIDLIYSRTHSDSPLRPYVMQSLSPIKDEKKDLKPYMELAHEHEDFFADLLDKSLHMVCPFGAFWCEDLSEYYMEDLEDVRDDETGEFPTGFFWPCAPGNTPDSMYDAWGDYPPVNTICTTR